MNESSKIWLAIVLVGVAVLLGGIGGILGRHTDNAKVQALEERVEKLEKAEKKPTCAEKHRKAFRKMGDTWWPLVKAKTDEAQEAGLESVDFGECDYFCEWPGQPHSPECHRCVLEMR